MAKAQAKRPASRRAFHIDWNQVHDQRDVIDDAGQVHGHCRNVGEASDLAVREAQHAHGAGEDIIVCLQQPDGTYQMIWSSR